MPRMAQEALAPRGAMTLMINFSLKSFMLTSESLERYGENSPPQFSYGRFQRVLRDGSSFKKTEVGNEKRNIN